MDTPRYDFHMHTKYLGCANETMEVEAIVRECERLGVTAFGITDHLNTLDRLPLHQPIKRDLAEIKTDVSVWFGVELNYTGCDEDFVYDEGIRDELGFQFAIGGIHGTYLETYDLTKLLEIQHRHHIKTCENPLVDVLVHPYWFGRSMFENNDWPWFDSVTVVPESYARELGQVARDTGTAVEINANANLIGAVRGDQYVEEYADYLAVIAEEGATFSVGSDAHAIGSLAGIDASWQMVERMKLPPERIYCPPGPPMIG